MRVVLAVVLALWEPLGFAAVAGSAQTLVARGPAAIVEFCWAGCVAALSVAAAWALFTRAASDVVLARAAIVTGLARDLQVLYWTALPSNVIPGTRLPVAAATTVACSLLWLAVARLARRSTAS